MALTTNVKINRSNRIPSKIRARVNAEEVIVGILEGATYHNGSPIAPIAYFMEYGTKYIPQRSFLRSTLREQKERYGKIFTNLMKKGYSVKDALDFIGGVFTDDVRTKIMSNIKPMLQDATVAAKRRKGYKVPDLALIASGDMERSIAHEVS